MAGYTRQDTANNIANGNVIDADDFDAEYNSIEAGFNASTGHKHDGSAGEGAPITKVGPAQDLVVSGTALTPKTTNTLDLGTSSVQFKNAWLDGTLDTDALVVSANATVGGTLGVTGDLSLGDNAKAIFGAGSDLQIYHDGNSSIIKETGSGDLRLQGANIDFKDPSGQTYAYFNDTSGAVSLYHNNAAKLATTSTGIDVTGAVTADGLTVDGTGLFSTGLDTPLRVHSTDSSSKLTISDDVGSIGLKNYRGRLEILVNGDASSPNNQSLAAGFDNNGDISFYEDTGTTPKFFWDASAESLGIGTTSPSATYSLDIAKGIRVSAAAPSVELVETDSSNQRWSMLSTGGVFGIRDITGSTYPVQIEATAPTNSMHIDSSGNVGIGTDSPTTALDVTGTILADGLTVSNGTNTTAIPATSDRVSFTATSSYVQSTGSLFVQPAGDLVLNGTGAEIMRLKGGNVGIGTTSPDTLLEVVGADPILTVRDTSTSGADANATLRLGESNASDTLGIHYDIALDNSALTIGYASTNVATTERMRIDSSGNVGIGTSVVQQRLSVSGNQRFYNTATDGVANAVIGQIDGQVRSYGAGIATNNFSSIQFATDPSTSFNGDIRFLTNGSDGTASSSTERMRIDSSGNVGIGTSSPTTALDVTGTITATSFAGDVTGNADTATALEASRNIQLTGDVTGSASFNGTANAVITATIADDSHNHVISNVDGLQTGLDRRLELINETVVATDVSDVTFTLPTGYKEFQLVLNGVKSDFNQTALYLTFSTDGGSTWDEGNDYNSLMAVDMQSAYGATPFRAIMRLTSGIGIARNNQSDTNTTIEGTQYYFPTLGASGTLTITNASNANSYTSVTGIITNMVKDTGTGENAGYPMVHKVGGIYGYRNVVNAINVSHRTGAYVAAGCTVSLYGMKEF